MVYDGEVLVMEDYEVFCLENKCKFDEMMMMMGGDEVVFVGNNNFNGNFVDGGGEFVVNVVMYNSVLFLLFEFEFVK